MHSDVNEVNLNEYQLELRYFDRDTGTFFSCEKQMCVF